MMLGGYRLLQMMAALAVQRTGNAGCLDDDVPPAYQPRPGVATREFAEQSPYSVPSSHEYWRIFDHIERGEQP